MCPVNLHQKFTGFTHSDKETGFLAASTHHNQEFSKKPGFWPPRVSLQKNRVFGHIYASQPRILEKTRFLAPARQSYESYNMIINLKSAIDLAIISPKTCTQG